jgi:hypothetical protein
MSRLERARVRAPLEINLPTRRGAVRLVAVTASVVATVFPAYAAATAAKVAGDPVVEKAGGPRAGDSHWTPARMRAALPAPTPRRAELVSPALPIPLPVVAQPLAPITSPSNRTSGKVFYTAGKWDYDCSGTAVASPSRSLVISAGHCGEFEGPKIRNWTFVPAYHDGMAPFGKWRAKRLAAPAGWVHAAHPPHASGSGGDPRFDVSAARVGRRKGRTLQSVVGGSRIAFDSPSQQQYDAIGYPAAGRFDGRSPYYCRSQVQLNDPSVGSPQPMGIPCDMTDGSSGGGWFDADGHLVSVTSYGYTDEPDVLYGPYFGAAIQQFYRSVKR